jgi:transcription elongation factor GreA
MAEVLYFTREGFDKLIAELHEAKTKGRGEAARAIAEAREKGDLSENAEYDAAKDAQGLLELKINQLEAAVANARVLEDTNLDPSKVFILSTVKLKNTKNNQLATYTLVTAKEADLKAGRISVDSPIGKGLLGKGKGDMVTIQAPAGSLQFQILEISR